MTNWHGKVCVIYLKPKELAVSRTTLQHRSSSRSFSSKSNLRCSAFRASTLLSPFYRDDIEQCQTVVDKLVAHAKAVGSRHDYTQALETLLPTSPIYDFLEGRIQRAALTFTRLAEIAEVDERERINREIGERRTRLGAKIGQVTSDVAREVYARSGLEALYQNVVDWTSDDEQRREYEEKLLQRAYDHLLVLPSGEKAEKRSQVVRLAHDMVIIKHPFPLAWRLELEWPDLEELSYLDLGILREYVEFFPDRGLANVIKAFLGVEAVQDGDQDGADADKEAQRAPKTRQLSAEDRLLLMTVKKWPLLRCIALC